MNARRWSKMIFFIQLVQYRTQAKNTGSFQFLLTRQEEPAAREIGTASFVINQEKFSAAELASDRITSTASQKRPERAQAGTRKSTRTGPALGAYF